MNSAATQKTVAAAQKHVRPPNYLDLEASVGNKPPSSFNATTKYPRVPPRGDCTNRVADATPVLDDRALNISWVAQSDKTVLLRLHVTGYTVVEQKEVLDDELLVVEDWEAGLNSQPTTLQRLAALPTGRGFDHGATGFAFKDFTVSLHQT